MLLQNNAKKRMNCFLFWFHHLPLSLSILKLIPAPSATTDNFCQIQFHHDKATILLLYFSLITDLRYFF